ncbi:MULTISPECIES: TIGR00153 family protein [unclassified Neochlamydia]|uniref:TIGR00153 family protein n=1 Tax=unclassified Neochlamydia TaxID=2643326 RepID=UPI0014091E29|nr:MULTISPECIES: TIGR00153 family protein [unclassified Neochlamydia]MBS4167119.1 UPF0111 protein [Neochlamydia sp. AcF65]MBS4170267.1 UPF0111 protein [Neochlamydia sp. AcF95]NGY95577.1 UPF0111 protein [Neochlamydia sp. AcF84]
MLKTILGIFGRSPFAPLQSHMEIVNSCVQMLPSLFEAMKNKDYAAVEKIAEKISEQEHHADLAKNHIRNHLPKNIYLPIERQHLLDILSLQDDIADKAQDLGVLSTLKPLEILPIFENEFNLFLVKNMESFEEARLIINELHELIETSFGGVEAEKVRSMVEKVAFKEHEVDILQRKLLKNLYHSENEMTHSTFYLWQKIFGTTGALSDISEKLANRVRLTLELQ